MSDNANRLNGLNGEAGKMEITAEKKAIFNRRKLLGLAGGAALGAAGLSALAPFSGANKLAMAADSAKLQEVSGWWRKSGYDLLDVIHKRRSCRNFTGEPVVASDLAEILAAGMSSPSTRNLQPWEFVVVQKPEAIAGLVKINPKASFLTSAGLVIVSCMDSTMKDSHDALLCSVACCNMNMWLTAESLGYGAVWLEVMPDKERMEATASLLKLPGHILPVSFMPIGKPTVRIPPENHVSDAKIHYNSW